MMSIDRSAILGGHGLISDVDQNLGSLEVPGLIGGVNQRQASLGRPGLMCDVDQNGG